MTLSPYFSRSCSCIRSTRIRRASHDERFARPEFQDTLHENIRCRNLVPRGVHLRRHDCVFHLALELGVVHYDVQFQTMPPRPIYPAAPTLCFKLSVFPVARILIFTYKPVRPTRRTRRAPPDFRLLLLAKQLRFRFGLFSSSRFCDFCDTTRYK